MAPAPAKGLPQRFDALAFLFNAAGRSGRTASLIGIAVVAVLIQPLQIIPPGWVHEVYGWTVGFIAFVIWGTFMARRLHDLGKAGWWIAPLFGLACLAPLAAPVVAWLGAGFGFLAVAIQVVLLLWPGQPGFNRFGPKPS